jgi:hypothetical protein
MGSYIQVLVFVIIGVALLWFGYSILIGQFAGIRLGLQHRPKRKPPRKGSGLPGEPQVCPVCSARLDKGQLVKSQAFPSLTGGKDRLMHIRGCAFCLGGSRARVCPVCGALLTDNDILIARMFERPHRRSHVDVLGCSRCKKVGKL